MPPHPQALTPTTKDDFMVEAPDRLHEAIDRTKTSREITAREIDAMARHIARKEVQQRWREQGHKRYDHSFKELCEAADALIRIATRVDRLSEDRP
jgi:sugar-specific transcriptional regulator TrmB